MGAGAPRWAADGGTEEGTGGHVCTHPWALSRFVLNEWSSRNECPPLTGVQWRVEGVFLQHPGSAWAATEREGARCWAAALQTGSLSV